MQPINYTPASTLLDDLYVLQEKIDAALKRTVLMLGGIVLPCAGLVIYVLASAGK